MIIFCSTICFLKAWIWILIRLITWFWVTFKFDVDLQHCFGSVFIWSGSGSSILDRTPIQIQSGSESGILIAKNWEKIYNQNLQSRTTIYLSIGLYKVCRSYRRSLQPSKREHPALQNMKFLKFYYFCWSFPYWIRIRIRILWSDWIWIRNTDLQHCTVPTWYSHQYWRIRPRSATGGQTGPGPPLWHLEY